MRRSLKIFVLISLLWCPAHSQETPEDPAKEAPPRALIDLIYGIALPSVPTTGISLSEAHDLVQKVHRWQEAESLLPRATISKAIRQRRAKADSLVSVERDTRTKMSQRIAQECYGLKDETQRAECLERLNQELEVETNRLKAQINWWSEVGYSGEESLDAHLVLQYSSRESRDMRSQILAAAVAELIRDAVKSRSETFVQAMTLDPALTQYSAQSADLDRIRPFALASGVRPDFFDMIRSESDFHRITMFYREGANQVKTTWFIRISNEALANPQEFLTQLGPSTETRKKIDELVADSLDAESSLDTTMDLKHRTEKLANALNAAFDRHYLGPHQGGEANDRYFENEAIAKIISIPELGAMISADALNAHGTAGIEKVVGLYLTSFKSQRLE